MAGSSRSVSTSSVLGEAAQTVVTTPILTPVALAVLSPEERFEKSFKEIKDYVRAHGWDAAAMFFGTAAYMGVYYLQDYFAIFGSTGRYIVHNLAMGVTANAVVLPMVWKGRRCEGETNAEAKQSAFRYFLLCSVPDSLYQPVEDWFIAMTKSGSFLHFDYVQDAVASFSPVELAAGFATFGVGYGLLYFVMKKLLLKHADEAESVEEQFEDRWQGFYKKSREFLQTPGWEATKSAIQYFIFYLSDYLFDLSLNGPVKTLLNLMGCCAWMSGYSFVFDNLPELFGYLQIRRELHLSLLKEKDNSLDSDYVYVSVDREIDPVTMNIIAKIVEKIVEPRIKPEVLEVTNGSSPAQDENFEGSIATTTSFSSDLSVSDSYVKLGDGLEEDGELITIQEAQQAVTLSEPLLTGQGSFVAATLQAGQNLVVAGLQTGQAQLIKCLGVLRSGTTGAGVRSESAPRLVV